MRSRWTPAGLSRSAAPANWLRPPSTSATAGTGTFAQTGGTNTVANYLYLGYGSGAKGTYTLSGTGQLATRNLYAGYLGTGTFTQTGGADTVTNSGSLYLGRAAGASGAYVQSGGTATITGSGKLYVGYGTGAKGTFTLSASGQLSAAHRVRRLLRQRDLLANRRQQRRQRLSLSRLRHRRRGNVHPRRQRPTVGTLRVRRLLGASTFTQTGGHNVVANVLYLGRYGGAAGTYTLSGGTLTAGRVLGGAGTSKFNFNGGVLQAGSGATSFFMSGLTARLRAEQGGVDRQQRPEHHHRPAPVGCRLGRRPDQARQRHAHPQPRQHLHRPDGDQCRHADW